MLKRSFDFLMSFFGLVFLFPLFVIIAFLIKLESKGPVFFRQIRVGKNGQSFRIHKFRTMTISAEEGGKLTVGDDDRITKVGRVLRKTKIDELPQLIDVLLGKMSLVGPRPEVPEFMELYNPKERKKILSVRPGITDKASIEMIDENKLLARYDDAYYAYINVVMPKKAKIYCDYVENQSFFGDIKIIFLTLLKIIRR